jgi:hypothetical protein
LRWFRSSDLNSWTASMAQSPNRRIQRSRDELTMTKLE